MGSGLQLPAIPGPASGFGGPYLQPRLNLVIKRPELLGVGGLPGRVPPRIAKGDYPADIRI
jgi:hypothetical protein